VAAELAEHLLRVVGAAVVDEQEADLRMRVRPALEGATVEPRGLVVAGDDDDGAGQAVLRGSREDTTAVRSEARVIALVEVLQKSAALFKEKGIDSPRLDAELIVGHVLALDRVTLYLQHDRPLGGVGGRSDPRARPSPRAAASRSPTCSGTASSGAWICWCGRACSCRAPTRRPWSRPRSSSCPKASGFFVADVGTGSGAVALAIAKERPETRVFATDVADEALRVAKENATRLGLTERVAFLKGPCSTDPARPSHRPRRLQPAVHPTADIAV
jgi:hypothetical protein